MKRKILLLVVASLAVDTAIAEEAKVTPLMSKELKDSPGKEGLMIVVAVQLSGDRVIADTAGRPMLL